MINLNELAAPDRKTCLAAIYVVSKSAKALRDLKIEAARFAYPDGEGFDPADIDGEGPSRELIELLEADGVEWEVPLFGTPLPAPYLLHLAGNYPSFSAAKSEMATDQLINCGTELDDSEECQLLIEQLSDEVDDALRRAQLVEESIRKLPAKLKAEAAKLYELKSAAIAALEIPLSGFHRGPAASVIFALFEEGGYSFHVPVRRSSPAHTRRGEAPCCCDDDIWPDDDCIDCEKWDDDALADADEAGREWLKTGIASVDAVVEQLNLTGELPAFAEGSMDRPVSARIDVDKSLGLGLDEAVEILTCLIEAAAAA